MPSVGLFQDNEPINRMLIVDTLSEHVTTNGQKYYDSKALKGSLCIWLKFASTWVWEDLCMYICIYVSMYVYVYSHTLDSIYIVNI